MTALAFLLKGAGLGLAAAGMPGPFQAFLITQALGGGWRRGAPVALAPLLTDAPIILLMVVVLRQVPHTAMRALSLAGGLFLLYLAWGVWRDWRSHRAEGWQAEGRGAESPLAGLRRAVVLNFLSPGPYLFWGLITGPLLLAAWRQSAGHALAFLAGFYVVFIGAMTLLVAVFHQVRRVGPALVRSLMLLAAGALLLSAGILLWDGLVGL